MRSNLTRVCLPTLFAAISYFGAQGCSSTDDAPPVDTNIVPKVPPEFDPLPLRVGVSKAKDLLTGLPITAEELTQAATPEGFKQLIDAWTTLPQFDDAMLRFFADAFQQSGMQSAPMEQFALALEQPNNGIDYHYTARKLRIALNEMFARTALGIVQEGRPFTEVATTTRFKLNTPLVATLLFVDAHPRSDNFQAVQDSWLLKRFPNFKFTAVSDLNPSTGQRSPIPVAESLDEKSENFMRWSFDRATCGAMGDIDGASGSIAVEFAYKALFGSRNICQVEPAFDLAEWNTWRWVSVRKAANGESPTVFWELPKLRAAAEIVVSTPRVGFFSTPAFFARWPTNPTNSFRGITNQALIVGLDTSMNLLTIAPQSAGSDEGEHARAGTPCFSCHQTLDPMRNFFRADYSTGSTPRPFGSAVSGAPLAPGSFTLGANDPSKQGVEALGAAIAKHPDFAKAWTQKLCVWANSARCAEDDPEFQRVAKSFKDSNHNFKTLLRELMTSPLSTFASRTGSSDLNGVAVGVARRELLCQRLSARAKRSDLCQQDAIRGVYDNDDGWLAQTYSQGLPAIGHLRGESLAVMPRTPGVLFQPAIERLCRFYSDSLVGQYLYGAVVWPTPTNPKELGDTLDEFVSVVIGVPKSDDAFPELRSLLESHYLETLALSKDIPHNTVESQALKSTFVAACSSPFFSSTGL
jgi:Protein of unknown function (DUF1585)